MNPRKKKFSLEELLAEKDEVVSSSLSTEKYSSKLIAMRSLLESQQLVLKYLRSIDQRLFLLEQEVKK